MDFFCSRLLKLSYENVSSQNDKNPKDTWCFVTPLPPRQNCILKFFYFMLCNTVFYHQIKFPFVNSFCCASLLIMQVVGKFVPNHGFFILFHGSKGPTWKKICIKNNWQNLHYQHVFVLWLCHSPFLTGFPLLNCWKILQVLVPFCWF